MALVLSTARPAMIAARWVCGRTERRSMKPSVFCGTETSAGDAVPAIFSVSICMHPKAATEDNIAKNNNIISLALRTIDSHTINILHMIGKDYLINYALKLFS